MLMVHAANIKFLAQVVHLRGGLGPVHAIKRTGARVLIVMPLIGMRTITVGIVRAARGFVRQTIGQTTTDAHAHKGKPLHDNHAKCVKPRNG